MSDYGDEEEQHDVAADEEIVVEQKASYELLKTPHLLDDSEIKRAQVQNNVVAILGDNGRFVALDQDGDDPTPYEEKVLNPHKLFLDPAGTHALATTLTGEVYYFNLKLRTKPFRFVPTTGQPLAAGQKPGGGVKLAVIESVGWDKHMDFEEISTGTILLGSREGHKVFQVMISIDRRDLSPRLEDCREIAVLPIADQIGSSPIIAIEMEVVNERRCVFAATPCNLYAVSGMDIDTYEEIFQEPAFLSVNVPAVEGQRGSFHIFRSTIGVGQLTGPPHSFVWTFANGLLHGVFAKQHTNRGEPDTEIVSLHETISFGPRYDGGFRRLPSEAVHSAFHMYVVHEDKMIVVGHPAGLKWVPPDGISLKWADFEEKIRFEPFKHRVTRTTGLAWDDCRHKAYCYNTTDIWEINVEREFAGFWRPFLERAVDPAENQTMRERYFDAAMKLTKDLPSKRDIVAMHFGRYWLKKGRAFDDQVITVLEKCSKFEEAYHLLARERPELLLPYVKHRYSYLIDHRRSGTEYSQIACLAAAVTAMHLEDVARKRDPKDIVASLREISEFLHMTNVNEPRLFEEPRYYLMIHNLVASHGYDSVILDLAKDLKRWRFTVGYSTLQQNFEGAIAVLDAHCADKPDLWIEFAATLLRQRPVQFLESMRRNKRLEKSLHQFLPAFLQYSQSLNEVRGAGDALYKFLYNCLQGSLGLEKDAADENLDTLGTWEIPSVTLKNFYVSLLASSKAHSDELERYLSHTDEYTSEYALRLCLENKLLSACVVLYRHMGFPEDAMEVALEIGEVDEAKAIAENLPTDTEPALKKRVWLQLVEYYVEYERVTDAIEYINNSGGVLKLEDVLSKVTDAAVIQGFKEPICNRLDQYSQKIKELDEDMKHAASAAGSIKDDIAALKSRFGYVAPTQRCEICRKSLLHGSQPFLVYPSCRHVCHEQCVVDHINSCGGLEFIARKCPDPTYLDGVHSVGDLAMAECVFCGECAIIEINAPFIVAGGDMAWSIE